MISEHIDEERKPMTNPQTEPEKAGSEAELENPITAHQRTHGIARRRRNARQQPAAAATPATDPQHATPSFPGEGQNLPGEKIASQQVAPNSTAGLEPEKQTTTPSPDEDQTATPNGTGNPGAESSTQTPDSSPDVAFEGTTAPTG